MQLRQILSLRSLSAAMTWAVPIAATDVAETVMLERWKVAQASASKLGTDISSALGMSELLQSAGYNWARCLFVFLMAFFFAAALLALWKIGITSEKHAGWRRLAIVVCAVAWITVLAGVPSMRLGSFSFALLMFTLYPAIGLALTAGLRWVAAGFTQKAV